MGREVRWLVEAKTPLEEVNAEEDKAASDLQKAKIKYDRANNVQQKDAAVALALNSITGTKAGDTLNRSLGIGMLTRFMDAFKWGSLTPDNLFVRILQRLFSGYKDSEVITKILSGQRPTADRDMSAKVNQSNLNKEVTEESLDEATLSPEAVSDLNAKIAANRANKNNSVNNNSVNKPINNNANKRIVPKYTINDEEAKILDMSPRDMFTILYNGYLNHLYTYEDLIDINNDTKDNSTIIGRDGKAYTIAKSLKDIVVKCHNDDNAFTTKGSGEQRNTSNNNNDTSIDQEVMDVKNKLYRVIKNHSLSDKDANDIIKMARILQDRK